MLLFKFGELGLEAVALGGGLLGVGAELLDPAVVGCVIKGREYMWDGTLLRTSLFVVRRALARRRRDGAACVVCVVARRPRRRRGGGR